MEKAHISGKMADNLKVITITISWKDTEFSLGQTAEFTKETTKQTKKVDMEFLHGLMVENTMETGKTENNMAKAITQTKTANVKRAIGTKAREQNGLTLKNPQLRNDVKFFPLIIK